MRLQTVICVVLLVAIPATLSAESRKKFGGQPGSKNSEYEGGDYESDYDYEDQDRPASKDKDSDKPATKPSTAAANKDLKDNTDNKNASSPAHSLFAPRRNRKPFSPLPSNRPKPTLPSFIRNPANPASLTTPKPRVVPVVSERPSTAKPVTSGRTTTVRPTKATGRRGASATTSPANADDNRRYGASSNRNNRNQNRGFRVNAQP